MGLTTESLPKLKNFYKKNLRSRGADIFIHAGLNATVNFLSWLKKFYFPNKFPWDWRLEMLLGKYEQETTDFFKINARSGMTIIDIGAHVGYYAVLLSKLTGPTGRVFAFEADVDNFRLLQKNAGRRKNVRSFNQAVSDRDGLIDFYKLTGSTGCHSLIAPQESEAKKITIPTTTIDSFIQKNQPIKVDFIKIDIEGGEFLAMLGMQKLLSQPDAPAIIMEFGPAAIRSAGFDPQEFLEKLRGFGFHVYELLPKGATRLFSQDEEIKRFNYYRTGFVNLLLKKADIKH